MATLIDEVITDKNQIKSQSGDIDFTEGEMLIKRNFGKIQVFQGPVVIQKREIKSTDKLYDIASFTSVGDAGSINDNFDVGGMRFLGSDTTLASVAGQSQMISFPAGSVRNHLFVVAKEKVTLSDQVYGVTQLRCGVTGSDTVISTSSYHLAYYSPIGAYPQMIYPFYKIGYHDLTSDEIASGIKIQNYIVVVPDGLVLQKMWVFGA